MPGPLGDRPGVSVQGYRAGNNLRLRLEYHHADQNQSVFFNGELMSSFCVAPGILGIHTFRTADFLKSGTTGDYEIRFIADPGAVIQIRYQVLRKEAFGEDPQWYRLDGNEELTGANIDCPYCGGSSYAKGEGETTCHKCENTFSVDEHCELAGRSIECPHCEDYFYTENTGRVACPYCKGTCELDDTGTLIGNIDCPACGANFREDFGGEIECPECSATFYLDDNGRPTFVPPVGEEDPDSDDQFGVARLDESEDDDENPDLKDTSI